MNRENATLCSANIKVSFHLADSQGMFLSALNLLFSYEGYVHTQAADHDLSPTDDQDVQAHLRHLLFHGADWQGKVLYVSQLTSQCLIQ